MHPEQSYSRRRFIQRGGLAAAAALVGGRAARGVAEETITLPFANGERELVTFPQKRKMILLTHRPPQLETPFSVFNEGVITPNDAFFVRYHLANIPMEIDAAAFRLEVRGLVKTPLSISLDSLRKDFDPVEVVAVNQCSGNSRGFFEPRVGGGQLANGAMGNAKWKGVRLKDLLEKAGVQAAAKQVLCDGMDKPVVEKTPDFVKALDIDQALDGEVLIAYEMNGADLPVLNGFPVRLVVPGHYGTYWVKHLNLLTVVDETFGGFWMNPAYRIPTTPGGCIEPGTKPGKTVPISRFNVRSFITSIADGGKLDTKRESLIRGIAFDGGSGIKEVLFSADGGRTWGEAKLGRDLGRYSFREWTIAFEPPAAGALELRCRAINAVGESQPMEAGWNPSGYMRNVVETVKITAA